MPLIENYNIDLQKSRTTPLLIELTKKDLDGFCINGILGLNIAIDSAKAIYDGVDELKNSTQSNIIYLDANKIKNMQHVFLLEVLLDILEDSIKNIKNLAIAKQGISSALSFVTGGILNAEIGSFLNDAVSSVVYQISEEVSDFLIDGIVVSEDISEQVSNLVEDKTFDFVSDTSANLIAKATKNNLYLTDASKKAVEKLSQQFQAELNPAESFTLVLEMLLALALEMPKILFIKDPHKLDKDSLAILSLLISISKNTKDSGKHTGLSVIYAYDDENFQPYQEIDEKYKIRKQFLDEQRLFAQRYAMLERPASDIPQVAAKSSVFVGRENELKKLKKRYFYSKENKDINTLEVISAEPGVGKTKLVKKHFYQIRSQEKYGDYQIQLSLLNQVGHSSTNTGLSSLINSIVQEAARLETYKTLTKRASEKIVDTVYSSVKSILGIDTFVDMGEAIGERIFVEEQLHKTKLNTVGDLDNKPQKRKEEQFLKLNDSIKELLTLSDEKIPIALFIDDLQWIDDDSAEYILQHFIEKFNVHIVSTMRPSDATTALKQAYEFKEINKYKIALLEKVGVRTTENSEREMANLQVDVMHLSGLDFTTLTSLIEQTIQGDIAYAKTLADTIVKKLNNDKDKDEVNTLFAVETINMLCDKKLYKNQEIEQLILTDRPLRFNPEINNFQKALEKTFALLLKKYEKSLSHYSDTTNENEQKFNLMAYAVLEERLNILKIYFAEHGNAAVNTLLFSSLLGTPFNSKIVKNILEAIATTDEELLQPLKEHVLDGKQAISLTEMHYEIIEEVYEILSRYTQFENSYEYRHSLLNIFLEKQFEYQINSVFKNNLVESKDKLYELILEEISEEKKLQDFYKQEEYLLSSDEYTSMVYFKQMVLNVLKKGVHNYHNRWFKIYLITLIELSMYFQHQKDIDKAIKILKKVEYLLSHENTDEYLEISMNCMHHLANCYDLIDEPKYALEYDKKNKTRMQKLYEKNEEQWAERYFVALNNLQESLSHYDNQLFKLMSEIIEKHANHISMEYTTKYFYNFALHLLENREYKNALKYAKKSYRISIKLDREKHIRQYIESVKLLAIIYAYLQNLEKSKSYLEKNRKHLKHLYLHNKALWVDEYLENLLQLAMYASNKIDFLEEGLSIIDLNYEKNPAYWSEWKTNFTEILKVTQEVKQPVRFEEILGITKEIAIQSNQIKVQKEQIELAFAMVNLNKTGQIILNFFPDIKQKYKISQKYDAKKLLSLARTYKKMDFSIDILLTMRQLALLFKDKIIGTI